MNLLNKFAEAADRYGRKIGADKDLAARWLIATSAGMLLCSATLGIMMYNAMDDQLQEPPEAEAFSVVEQSHSKTLQL